MAAAPALIAPNLRGSGGGLGGVAPHDERLDPTRQFVDLQTSQAHPGRYPAGR